MEQRMIQFILPMKYPYRGPGRKEVSDQLQFVGLWDCVCKQVRKDPEKVVITNVVSGQLGTDATWVSPDKLAGRPIDQGMMYG